MGRRRQESIQLGLLTLNDRIKAPQKWNPCQSHNHVTNCYTTNTLSNPCFRVGSRYESLTSAMRCATGIRKSNRNHLILKALHPFSTCFAGKCERDRKSFPWKIDCDCGHGDCKNPKAIDSPLASHTRWKCDDGALFCRLSIQSPLLPGTAEQMNHLTLAIVSIFKWIWAVKRTSDYNYNNELNFETSRRHRRVPTARGDDWKFPIQLPSALTIKLDWKQRRSKHCQTICTAIWA